MSKQSDQKQIEKMNQDRIAYLLRQVDQSTLKRFTKKRAEKVASITLWYGEDYFTRIVDASKGGIAYAERFIAVADSLAKIGIKETEDLWGKSDFGTNRRYLDVVRGLTDISMSLWSQNARLVIFSSPGNPHLWWGRKENHNQIKA